MKKILFFLFCVILCSCKSTKDTLKSFEQEDLKTTKQETTNESANKLVDTTKTEKGKITITEIQFYPPSGGVEEPNGTDDKVAPSKIPKQPVKNAIKSIKQTTIETEKEEKGESEESQTSSANNNEATALNTKKDIKQEVAPAPDPYKWRYIFYIGLLIVGVLLYLNRTTVIKIIKDFFKRK